MFNMNPVGQSAVSLKGNPVTNHPESPLPRYTMKRLSHAPSLADPLTDPVWEEVKPILLVDATTGDPPRYATEVRAGWTQDAIHVHYRCEDSDIYNDFRKRDEPIFDHEVVELFVAAEAASPEKYFEFEVSPYNVQWDGRIVNHNDSGAGLGIDSAWNAPSFHSAVVVLPAPQKNLPECSGWVVQFSIGFKDLSVPDGALRPGDVWRANFLRIERRPVEQFLAWSPTYKKNPADFHVPSRFGMLIFDE